MCGKLKKSNQIHVVFFPTVTISELGEKGVYLHTLVEESHRVASNNKLLNLPFKSFS